MQTNATYKVSPFLQDLSAQYTTAHGLPDAPVHALAIASEAIYAGTPQGVYRASLQQPDRWQKVADQPATHLIPDGAGSVVGIGGRRLFRLDAGGQMRTLYEADAELIGLQAAARGGYWTLTQDALLRVQDGKVAERMPAPTNRQLRWFHEDTRGRLYAYAEGELERRFYRWQEGEWQLVPIKEQSRAVLRRLLAVRH
jgi:hypothetical protein